MMISETAGNSGQPCPNCVVSSNYLEYEPGFELNMHRILSRTTKCHVITQETTDEDHIRQKTTEVCRTASHA
jgi:hypothetical protein